MNTAMRTLTGAVAIGACCLGAGCGGRKGGDAAATKSVEDIRREKGVPVRTAAPVTTNLYGLITFDGTVEPRERAVVMAQVAGQVMQVHVEAGDEVLGGPDGTPLVTLDSAQAEADLAAAKTAFEDAGAGLTRAKQLLEAGAVSQQDVDRAAVAANQAKAALVARERNMAFAKVRAPIAGFVARKLVEPGQLALPGTPLVEIVDVSRLRVEILIPETQVRYVKDEMECRIAFDAYPDLPALAARIDALHPALDSETRGLTARIFLEPPADMKIVPGMHAMVRVAREARQSVIAVPAAALVTLAGARGVFVVESENVSNPVEPENTEGVWARFVRRFRAKASDGAAKTEATSAIVARFRKLEPGLEAEGFVEVVSGLTLEDRLVVDGQKQLSDGAKVDVLDGGGK